MRVIVADDEPLARKRLKQLLHLEHDCELVRECSNAQEALSAIKGDAPDLVILDVRMSGKTGLEVAAELRGETAPVVIFVTAYDEYAVRAFDVSAIDYLLKPVEPRRFRQAIEKARLAVHGRALSDAPAITATSGEVRDRILIRANNRLLLLKSAEVHWVKAAGNYVRFHTSKGVFLVRDSLSNVETFLDPASFVRIHRSAVINLERIADLKTWFSGEMVITMEDGTKLRMSRTYRRELQSRIKFLS